MFACKRSEPYGKSVLNVNCIVLYCNVPGCPQDGWGGGLIDTSLISWQWSQQDIHHLIFNGINFQLSFQPLSRNCQYWLCLFSSSSDIEIYGLLNEISIYCIICWEPVHGVLSLFSDVPLWTIEGCYHCAKSMVLVPFCFPTEHGEPR